MQLVARALTPPEHNVNIAFALYDPVARALPGLAASFPLAWAANVAAFCLAMLVLDTALSRITKS
jgi:hypothetical protein